MQFQNISYDPFAYSFKLQQAGLQNEASRLDNAGKSVDIATGLYKLGIAREQFKEKMDATLATARSFQQAGTGDPSETPSSIFTSSQASGAPTDSTDVILQNLGQQYKHSLTMAAIKGKQTLDPEAQREARQYSEDSVKILKDAQGVLKDKHEQDAKKAIDISKMFLAGADSPEAFGTALRAFMYEHPDFNPNTLESKFGFKMVKGVPVWDPNRLKTLGNMMLTAKDKLTIQHNQEMEKLTGQLRVVQARRAAAEERRTTILEAEARDRGLFDGEGGPKGSGKASGGEGTPKPNKSLTGEEYLASLPPSRQSLVKGIADGRIDPRTLSYRDRTAILADVTRYKPGYQQFKYPVYAATLKDFSDPKGMAGRNIVAINTAIGHGGTLFELAQAMNNHDNLTTNRILNAVATEFGDPRINNFQVAAAALSSEMMRVFRQVGASEKEQKEWEEKFSNIQSAEQAKGAVQTAVALLNSRIKALDAQWKRAMDTDKDYPNMLDKHSAQVLQEIGALNIPSEKALVNKDKPMPLDEYLKAHGGQ